MKCKKHPKYRAVRPPTADCDPCRDMYAEAQAGKMSRPTAAPTKKPKTAAELIAARKPQTIADPPAAALAELKELLEYNDGQSSPNRRIGANEAVTMLRTHGWQGVSRNALDSLCTRAFGRGSYGTA